MQIYELNRKTTHLAQTENPVTGLLSLMNFVGQVGNLRRVGNPPKSVKCEVRRRLTTGLRRALGRQIFAHARLSAGKKSLPSEPRP
jgi:hypothetical protein